MKKIKIGHYQQQPSGYKAFVPLTFPPLPPIILPPKVEVKHSEAMRLLGKLDGLTQLLPDKDFFLMMFVRKEAASSNKNFISSWEKDNWIYDVRDDHSIAD